MKRSFLLISTALVGLTLTGCVSLGMSQAQSETAYTVGAGITDGLVVAGKMTPDLVGGACSTDNINYGILVSTRNIGDGANYTLADNAHKKLQTDGAKLNGACTPPA